MARRKKHGGRKTHRRRRTGIHGASLTVKPNMMSVGVFLAEMIGGYVVASMVDNKFLENVVPDQPLIKHGGFVAIGGGAAAMVKNHHVKAVGLGMALYGGINIAKDTKVIGDIMIGNIDTIMENIMIGSPNQIASPNYIAYPENMSQEGLMNGTEEISEEVMM